MPLADAFVSDPIAVSKINEATKPIRDLDAVDVKGIDIVKLGQLSAILGSKAFVDVLPEFPEVHAVSDDGPWVFKVSPQLVTALATMDEPQIVRTAAQWSAIEEFKLDGFETSTVTTILRSFKGLARNAKAQSKDVYLWTCL